MPEVINLSYSATRNRAHTVAGMIREGAHIYGVPRGGIPAALMVMGWRPGAFHLVEDPQSADVIVDDIIDSGRTRDRFPGKVFHALVDKQMEPEYQGKWVTFFWERMAAESGPEDAVTRLLQYIGEDPNREGLKETPKRVVNSYAEMFAGYKQDPKEIIKTFEDGVCDEMVLLKNCEFSSFCEHHMLPFIGKAHIAYIPKERVIGVSKLARLLEIYSRRLQIQERLSQQITKALMDYLQPLGAACVLEASHLCMQCRGVRKQDSLMVTSSLLGVFRDPAVRAELFSLIKG